MNTCIMCKHRSVSSSLLLRDSPFCHAYMPGKQVGAKNKRHRLELGYCSTCGFIQILNPVPYQKLRPTKSWMIKYTEPEAHLDVLAKNIQSLPGISKASSVCAISYKDDTLVTRLQKLQFTSTHRLHKNDLGIPHNLFGIETVQHHLDMQSSENIIRTYGKSDICIVRHFLEHCYDPHGAIEAVKKITRRNGYIVLEVPNVQKSLEAKDYTMIWEEHAVYFTKELFQFFLEICNLEIIYLNEIQYPLENSLVAIVRNSERKRKKIVPHPSRRYNMSVYEYFSRFEQERSYVQDKIRSQQPITLLGAGHLASMWVYLFSLERQIDRVYDDDREKVGTVLPGTDIRIEQVPKKNINHDDMCLLAANPSRYTDILKTHGRYLRSCKSVLSIFPQCKNDTVIKNFYT